MWQRARIIDPTNEGLHPPWLLGMLIWVRVGRPFVATSVIDFYTREEVEPHEVFLTNLLDNDNIFVEFAVIYHENCELLGEFAKDEDIEYISLQSLEELAGQLN